MSYATTTKPKIDIHEEVTNNIIGLLDQVDYSDYQSPFAGLVAQGIPENPTTKKTYQGVNILSLWFNQQSKQFTSNHWASFKQWKDNGAHVRKGEKGSRVIFYKTLEVSEENSKGEDVSKKIPMLKVYTVFNENQIEGYKDPAGNEDFPVDKVEKIKLVDRFCEETKATITNGEGLVPYYEVNKDFISLPETVKFRDTDDLSATEHYYSILLHELTHWTGAKKRLNRPGITEKVNQEQYAFEELIAELGAAFLCAQHGISQSTTKNHAAYIKSWLQALKEDKTYIFKASAQAAKAVDFLNHLQPEV